MGDDLLYVGAISTGYSRDSIETNCEIEGVEEIINNAHTPTDFILEQRDVSENETTNHLMKPEDQTLYVMSIT